MGSKYDSTDGKVFGRGNYISCGGTKFESEWKENLRHGREIEAAPDGIAEYESEWKVSFLYGRGTYTWPDGEKYEGDWKNGGYHGRGTYTWSDGRKYEGEWMNDIEGSGKVISQEGVMECKWVCGEDSTPLVEGRAVFIENNSKVKFFRVYERGKMIHEEQAIEH